MLHGRTQTKSEGDEPALIDEAPMERTHEFGSYIIEAIATNRPIKINGNVANRSLITNLPQGCCVEVPCLVDGNGIHPRWSVNCPRNWLR